MTVVREMPIPKPPGHIRKCRLDVADRVCTQFRSALTDRRHINTSQAYRFSARSKAFK